MEHKYWFYTFLLVCEGTVALDVTRHLRNHEGYTG